MGPFEALISGFIIAFLGGMVLTLVPLGLAYVALRVRDSRHTRPDPALGLKTAFHLVHSLAVLMILTGLSVSAVDLMEGRLTGNPKNQPRPNVVIGRPQAPPPAPGKDDFWNNAQRSAAALAATGFLFALVFWGLLRTGTNDRKYTAVRRTFVGGRLAVGLLVVFATVTVTALTMAQKDPKLEPVEAAVGVLIVWLPGSAVHLYLFHRVARLPTEPALRGIDDEG